MNTSTNKNTLDCRGMFCPLPMIHLKKAIKKIETGESIFLVATDSAIVNDIKMWAERSEHKVVQSSVSNDEVYSFTVEKV